MRQEDVRRLQVAVHDPSRVRGGEPVGHGSADLKCLFPRQFLAGNPPIERFALKKLRDRIDDSVRAPEIVDREDVRVRKRRDRPGLVLESRQRLRVVGEAFRQDLYRDVATESGIPRAKNLAHPARAER